MYKDGYRDAMLEVYNLLTNGGGRTEAYEETLIRVSEALDKQ